MIRVDPRMTCCALLAACALASGSAESQTALQPAASTQERLATGGGRPQFVRPPADPDEVAAVIPLGNVNPAPEGGHIRPVNHMYLDYVTPRNGGSHLVDVYAMAAGSIVALVQRQTEIQGVGTVDEYQVWIQHTDEVTIYYDHLHDLDARLGLPDWRDPTAGWVNVGPGRFLFLGLNGARDPVRVHPGQRMGGTRNYFTNWDIGVVDTRHVGNFLGHGLLRYPSFPEFLAQYISEGGDAPPLDPDQPFPGEGFVNSTCFIDYMTPPLAARWRPKLVGDGSCGRPDWDRPGTLLGNWYRADVTAVTFENMLKIEENSISFSPYNRDPSNKVQIGIGKSFVANWPATSPPIPDSLRAAATDRLTRQLVFTPDRTPGTERNPDPANVGADGHACYDIPAPEFLGATHRLLVYHHIVDGVEHVELRYGPAPCTVLPVWSLVTVWWGDYVR
jgi:hypothetical protein